MVKRFLCRNFSPAFVWKPQPSPCVRTGRKKIPENFLKFLGQNAFLLQMATHIRTSKIVSDCKKCLGKQERFFPFIKAPLKLGFWCFLIVVLELLQEVAWLILAISVDCWAQVRTSSTAKAWICVKLPASDLSFGAALDFPSAKFWICLSLDPQPDVHFAPQRGREINGKSSLLSNLQWGLVNFCHLFITFFYFIFKCHIGVKPVGILTM